VDSCKFTDNVAQAGDGAAGASGQDGHGGGQALGGGIVEDALTIAVVTNSHLTHDQALGGQGGQLRALAGRETYRDSLAGLLGSAVALGMPQSGSG
jgi:hypothetical protein